LIVDAGVLYVAADSADANHRICRELLVGWSGELVVSSFTAAEADYLILKRLGLEAELLFVEDLAGAYAVESLDRAGLERAGQVCARYADLELGLADASMVVLAERWATTTLATFDERHFRAVEPLSGGSFRLLPADL
jgi:predicted nucleic acid-binding protein